MIKLTEQDIAEYIRAWYEEFGEWLSWDDARAEAHRTMDLFTLVAELTKDWVPLEFTGLLAERLSISSRPDPLRYTTIWGT